MHVTKNYTLLFTLFSQQVKLAKFMSYVYSSYAIDRLDPEALCRDQEVVRN